jgi:hypothetical protein
MILAPGVHGDVNFKTMSLPPSTSRSNIEREKEKNLNN